jgi:hypothetical protein
MQHVQQRHHLASPKLTSHFMSLPMHILLETGTEWLHWMTQVLPSHDLAMSSYMPAVLLHGVLSCKPSLHFLPAKPNMWHFLSLYEIPSISWTLSMNSRITDCQSQVLNQEYSARLLKITQVLSNWCIFQRWDPTKHINIKYHHFREHVCLGLIEILPISTSEQLADIFTKPLAHTEHTPFSSCLRKALAAALLASSHGCFINSYWMRECDITVNLPIHLLASYNQN